MTRLDLDEQQSLDNRRSDDRWVQKWLPIMIQLGVMLVTLGLMWGSLNGRLLLIEWRIGQVEQKVWKP